jgi:arginase family enzyme
MQKLLFLISSKSRFHGDVAKSRLPLKAITRRGAYRYHSTARKSEVPVPLVALLGIPEDRNSSYLHGPAKAPDIIRKFFHEPAVNTFCELGHDVSKYLVDVGNIIPQSNMGDGFYESVRPAVQSMVNGRGLIPLIVGGDHSITFPVCRAINDVFNEPLTIVHFDAHPDLYESYDGNKNSHASPFARICETPDLCCRLIQLGIRTTNDHQKSQQRRFGIFSLDAKSFPAHGSDAEGYLKKLISNNAKVYISIDVDVLEPVGRYRVTWMQWKRN